MNQMRLKCEIWYRDKSWIYLQVLYKAICKSTITNTLPSGNEIINYNFNIHDTYASYAGYTDDYDLMTMTPIIIIIIEFVY
jgi:hypothetical protein